MLSKPLPMVLRAVWGFSKEEVFAAGDAGAIFRYGLEWKPARVDIRRAV